MMGGCQGCQNTGDHFALAMAFQPIVDITTGSAWAYEALVRGTNGESAGEMIGRVTEQNRYAFDQQCRVAAITQAVAAGIVSTGARLSINFLPNAVYSPLACIQLTLKTAAAVGFPTERLIFEFTENEEMGSPEHVTGIIDTYKQIGFSVAIDDFGAGHSGLDMFARFVPDEIKLDMDLIRDIDTNARRRAIVRSMVGMCQELDTLLIAEGIETAAEAAVLNDLGVRYHQGYWYARPELERLPQIRAEALAG